jgi:hypothetical protein
VIIVFIIISVAMKHDVGCSDDGCGTWFTSKRYIFFAPLCNSVPLGNESLMRKIVISLFHGTSYSTFYVGTSRWRPKHTPTPTAVKRSHDSCLTVTYVSLVLWEILVQDIPNGDTCDIWILTSVRRRDQIEGEECEFHSSSRTSRSLFDIWAFFEPFPSSNSTNPHSSSGFAHFHNHTTTGL